MYIFLSKYTVPLCIHDSLLSRKKFEKSKTYSKGNAKEPFWANKNFLQTTFYSTFE